MINFNKLFKEKINRFLGSFSKINNFVSAKLEKILLKRISPIIGRFLDKMFLTSFSRLGVNFYHNYGRNDYIIDNSNLICFIHLPKTAGISIRETLKKNGFPLFTMPKNSYHNPVSLYCCPSEFKYFTVMRNPLYRVYSQYEMFKRKKENIAKYGLINTVKTQISYKNLACQYYSGLSNEIVDENIFSLAKKNLENFFFIIDFNNIESDLEKMLKKVSCKNNIKIEHQNSYSYEKMSTRDKEAIKVYNYWDLKLYEYYEKNLKN